MHYKYISSSWGQKSTCISQEAFPNGVNGQDVNIQMRSGTGAPDRVNIPCLMHDTIYSSWPTASQRASHYTMSCRRRRREGPSQVVVSSKSCRQASHYTIFVVRRIRSETTGNRRGSWHMTDIGTLAFHHLTLHDLLLAIVFSWDKTQSLRNLWTYSKYYDGLRYPPKIVLFNHNIMSNYCRWRRPVFPTVPLLCRQTDHVLD